VLKHRHTTAWVWCNYVVKVEKIYTVQGGPKRVFLEVCNSCTLWFRRANCAVFAAPPLGLNMHWLPTSARLSSVCCPSVVRPVLSTKCDRRHQDIAPGHSVHVYERRQKSHKCVHKYNKLALSQLKWLLVLICGWNRKLCGVH